MDTSQATISVAAPANYGSSEAKGGRLISALHLMPFMKYMPPLAPALVALKYQAKTESPFWENPAPVWCFLGATGVYWLLIGVMKQMTSVEGKYFWALSDTALASAVLSALSLVSMFLVYPVSLVPLMIWIPLPIVLARSILYHVYCLLKGGIISVINKLKSSWV